MKSGSQVDAYDPGGANGVTDPNLFLRVDFAFLRLLKEGCRWLAIRLASGSNEDTEYTDRETQRGASIHN